MNILFAALIISAVFVGTRRVAGPGTRSSWRTRAEKDVRARLGYETAQELRKMQAEERAIRADFHEGAGFWID